MATGYMLVTLAISHSALKKQLEAICVQVCAADLVLKIWRIDNEFETDAIRMWMALCTSPITLENRSRSSVKPGYEVENRIEKYKVPKLLTSRTSFHL